MKTPTDETFLSIDGFLFVDPATEMRQRAESFLASHQWTTSQVFYGDQPEAEEVVEQQPAWSMTFILGLDHIKATDKDWFSDVTVLLDFVQTLQRELDTEFVAEVRYLSKLWYSEHITFVDDGDRAFSPLRDMIARVT